MSDTDIENRLNALLNQAARNLNLEDFAINLSSPADRGDGFLGTIYKASILDRTTASTVKVIIKSAPEHQKRRNEMCIDSAYKNEINFYTEVVPVFRKFQEESEISKMFVPVPRYLASVKEKYRELIALEDITSFGYQMWQKDLLLDEEHTAKIFETYSKFHALSFCMQDRKPEEYAKLTEFCHNVFREFKDKRGFSYSLQTIAAKSLSALDPDLDSPVREKFQKYVDNTMEIFGDVTKYKGRYSSILHGDCWSNNLMFKYENPISKSGLESINLLDFQFVWVGTPVFDLSYFFYSGGSRTLFQKLEYFLDLYYESFSSFSKKFGCDPQKIFPREQLAKDWKEYSRFGMLMSLLLVQVKLMSKSDSAEIAENTGKKPSNENQFINSSSVNENVFNERIRDILIHMYEIEAL